MSYTDINKQVNINKEEGKTLVENALINVEGMMALENHLLPSHHKYN